MKNMKITRYFQNVLISPAGAPIMASGAVLGLSGLLFYQFLGDPGGYVLVLCFFWAALTRSENPAHVQKKHGNTSKYPPAHL